MTLIALACQFALGMVANLFVQVPPADAHAGFVTEIRTAPLALTLHAVLGTFLVCAACALLMAAARARDWLMIACTATGLVSIVGAFVSGELFVRDGRDGVSLSMALLTCVALVCYAGAVARAAAPAADAGLFRRRVSESRAFRRRAATRTRPGQRTSRRRRKRAVSEKSGPPAAISVASMCIAFDGAYILEAPTTHPATTDEGRPVPERTTADADGDVAVVTERPAPLEFATG